MSYTRADVKLFVNALLTHGNKTATIRRRINCIAAILNCAYAELDADKRNPFSRLFIKGEGQDAHNRVEEPETGEVISIRAVSNDNKDDTNP